MLRPRKKYTVHDLQQLKGKRCLTHIHVKSPEEAAAADAAGVDLMSCPFDSAEAHDRWRDDPRHRAAQALGRDEWYAEYWILVCDLVAERRFASPSERAEPGIDSSPSFVIRNP